MANFPNYGSLDPVVTVIGPSGSRASFSTLSDEISSQIFSVNHGAATLEMMLKQIGSTKDGTGLRDRVDTMQKSTNDTIYSIMRLMKELTSVALPGNRQQALQVERLENEFKFAVQRYNHLQREITNRVKFTPLPKVQKSSTSGWTDDDEENQSNNQLEVEAQRRLEQQQLDKELAFEQGLMEEREARIRELEANVIDVNEIFRQLGDMVHQQNEPINTIEANVDKTYYGVDSGHQQLIKAAEYQNRYRKKLCCFAGIVALVGIILVIVIVTSVKK